MSEKKRELVAIGELLFYFEFAYRIFTLETEGFFIVLPFHKVQPCHVSQFFNMNCKC